MWMIKWFDKAKWWHIWNPGSGFLGGTVLAIIVILSILFIFGD